VKRTDGTSSWEKPKLLLWADLPSQPKHSWVAVNYEYEGYWYIHYVNPWTGKYCNYSADHAAKIIQSMARKFLIKMYMLPISELRRVVKIAAHALESYNANRKKLSSVINYALVSQVVELEEAIRLYEESSELSAANPLVCRAVALFQISTLQAPMQVARERAMKEILSSKRKDESNAKFNTALSIYKYACLRRPDDFRPVLNLALVYLLIYEDLTQGERLLRRVVAMDPFEERVMEMWKLFRDHFTEGHSLHNLQSRVEMVESKRLGKKRTLHGRVVTEDPQWAGWVYVDAADNRQAIARSIGAALGSSTGMSGSGSVAKRAKTPSASTGGGGLGGGGKALVRGAPTESYWYNPADGTETWEQPDFTSQWQVRMKRSAYQNAQGNLELYWDPLTNQHFNYHPVTGTFA
jgi:hypothetical protein